MKKETFLKIVEFVGPPNKKTAIGAINGTHIKILTRKMCFFNKKRTYSVAMQALETPGRPGANH